VEGWVEKAKKINGRQVGCSGERRRNTLIDGFMSRLEALVKIVEPSAIYKRPLDNRPAFGMFSEATSTKYY
jgi:hypothetical protein